MSNTDTFAEHMERERERINGERDALLEQKNAIELRLQALHREHLAVDAYETAKAGKFPTQQRVSRGVRTNGARRPRAGSRREAIVQTLAQHPQGLTRGVLLQYLGVKGDTSAEMSVSNALSSMIKNNTLARVDGRYLAA